jgi:undecaprenyl-diphosphatase
MATRDEIERRVSLRWPLISSGIALGLVAVLAVLVGVRQTTDEVDAEWMEEILEHRNPLWEAPSLVMNFIGAGWFAIALPAAIAVVFLIRRRPWTALYVVLASGVSAGLVQLLKVLIGRHRPEFKLVQIDSGSFPSGHSANAATLAAVLFIIFPRVWVWIVGVLYTVAMMVSRTYLGVHWLTDTIAGLLLGVAIAIAVWAPLASRMRREHLRADAESGHRVGTSA